MATEQARNTVVKIYPFGELPASIRQQWQEMEVQQIIFNTTNWVKLETIQGAMPFNLVTGTIVVPVEELAQTVEGNLDEKLQALLKLIKASPHWERRLNLIHSKGYLTDDGYQEARALYRNELGSGSEASFVRYAELTELFIRSNPNYFRDKPAKSREQTYAGAKAFRAAMLQENHAYMVDDSDLTLLYGSAHPMAGEPITIRHIYQAAYAYNLDLTPLTNALLSVLNQKTTARAVQESPISQLQSELIDMPTLLRALNQLLTQNPEYNHVPGPDGADLYKYGFHELMASILRVLDAMDADAQAVSKSIVSLLVEKPDGTFATWTDQNGITQTAIRIEHECLNDLKSLEELLAPGFSMHYVEDILRPDRRYPRREIVQDMVDASTFTPVNSTKLCVAVVVPDNMAANDPYRRAVQTTLSRLGHKADFYASSEVVEDGKLLRQFFDKHGLYIILSPDCVDNLSTDEKKHLELLQSIVVANLLDHKSIGPPDRRYNQLLVIGSKELESWVEKCGHIGTAAHHRGLDTHYVSTTADNVGMLLKEKLKELNRHSFCRLQGTRQPTPVLSMPLINAGAPSYPKRDGDLCLPVLPVYFIGSATNNRADALAMTQSVINALIDWGQRNNIVLDMHHGGGAHSQMALFSKTYQRLALPEGAGQLFIGAAEATTRELSALEGEGKRWSLESAYSGQIAARKDGIFQSRPGMEKAPMVIVCAHGGIGTMNEVFESLKIAGQHGREPLFIIVSPSKQFRKMVRKVAEDFGVPNENFVHITGRSFELQGIDPINSQNVPTMQRLCETALVPALNGLMERNAHILPYLTVPEICRLLPALPLADAELAAWLQERSLSSSPLITEHNVEHWPQHLAEALAPYHLLSPQALQALR